MITLQQLAAAVQCTTMTAEAWHVPLSVAMAECNITTPLRMAAFLAQLGHESISLSVLEENLNYSAQRLTEVWPHRFPTLQAAVYYEHSPPRLANLVYANRMGNGDYSSGDGWRYHGRGPIQLTGADNYRAAGDALGLQLLELPEIVGQIDTGARVSAWFWQHAGCNAPADAGDFDQVSDLINIGRHTERVGDAQGYADRHQRYERALKVLSCTPTA
jgi:putative chitinase